MRLIICFTAILVLFAFLGCTKIVVVKSKPVEDNHHEVIKVSKSNPTASDKHLRQAKKFYNAAKYKQSKKHCEKAIAFNHRNWEAHYYLGLSMQKKRQYAVSIETFGVSLKYSPDNNFVKSELHFSIGASWEKLGHLTNAGREYVLALEFNPANKAASNAKNRVKVGKTIENWKKNKKIKYDG